MAGKRSLPDVILFAKYNQLIYMYMFNSINFPERNDLRTFLTSS